MSDFQLSCGLRGRLLQGDYSPLDFEVKPYGLEPGAVYVLAWTRAYTVVSHPGKPWEIPKPEDVTVARIPRRPVWFITVTDIVRHRKGFWRVKFDVTDNRDSTLYLGRGSDYTASKLHAVDRLPVVVTDEVRAKAVEEFDHQRRLAKHAEEQRERHRARRKRAA